MSESHARWQWYIFLIPIGLSLLAGVVVLGVNGCMKARCVDRGGRWNDETRKCEMTLNPSKP